MINFKKLYGFFALLFVLLLSVNELKAQCDIHSDVDISGPVCYQTRIRLSVDQNINYSYSWTKNGIAVGDYYFIDIKVTENNSVYSVLVTNTETGAEICHPSVTILMRPKFDITFEQLRLTCSNREKENGNNAQVKATASGGEYSSFIYHWNMPNSSLFIDPQVAMNMCAYTNYTITVTGINADGTNGCSQTDTVNPKAYPNPNIKIFSDPADTVYIDNPYVTWSFTNNDTVYNGHDTLIEVYSYSWKFDGYEESFTAAEPQVSFTEEGYGNAWLNVVASDTGCDTTFNAYINVLPVKLKIPNIFTPNGDGINDYFEIGYGETGQPINDLNIYFKSHKLTIFNRWGRIVYKSSNYRNDWSGGDLPDGTYFYVLECNGEKNSYRYQGAVMIWNSGR